MEENQEAEALCHRISEVSVWLHGYSFYNNLIYNQEFDVLSLMNKARDFKCSGVETNIEYIVITV